MNDLLENAEKFYQENPLPPEKDPNYLTLTKELSFIIETASFLSEGEKRRLKGLLGIMSVKMLESLRLELLQEGLSYHDRYPQDKKMTRWLKLMTARPKMVKN